MNTPTVQVPGLVAGQIEQREVPLLVAYTNSPLAITQQPDSTLLTITHLPSGMALPVAHHDQGELTQLLDELVNLGDWPETQEELLRMPGLVMLARETIDRWVDAYHGGIAA